jgi:hypothetical protein
LGRLLRVPIVERYGQTATWLRAEAQFQRRGGLAVYLTRWLLTPLSCRMNLTAAAPPVPALPASRRRELTGWRSYAAWCLGSQ